MVTKSYLEQVYAGFLGMNIGIRLGAPVEPGAWTYNRIWDTYGDIRDYVKEYKKFAADDDVNGPVYFLRALRDKWNEARENGAHERISPEDVAKAWLNYTREGIGMFWWGGYGVSTEHTAYLNLKNGIGAPQSGSIQQNGKTMAEQIGGQIFIDTWGLIHPGDPKAAADDAEAAASVSHDGEGLNGARFFGACIAKAFESDDIMQVIWTGLTEISEDSLYAAVVKAVICFYQENPKDWRACFEMLVRNWGYDRYPGACHIIPNAGVCVLAMVYGNGDFARTVEIATMCGWDTDCNAGNVGTVLGVMNGVDGLPGHYRKPINDSLIISGISGYLNILDVPTYAKELASLGCMLQGVEIPKEWNVVREGELWFDFDIPGSTHGIEVSNSYHCTVKQSGEKTYGGFGGSLKIMMDCMIRGDVCKIFYKPFYSRDAFSDERYSPVLTPTVYSGQTVSMKLYLDQWEGWDPPSAAPYVRTAWDKKEMVQGYTLLKRDQWMELCFVIPDTKGELIDELGIVLTANTSWKSQTLAAVYMDDFRVYGAADYRISFSKQKKELGTVTPFSVDHGAWELADGKMLLMCCEDAYAYAGNYYTGDCEITAGVTPLNGISHLLLIRAQGAMRFYAAGLEGENKAVIYKNNFGYEILAEQEFEWDQDMEYQLTLAARGKELIFSINGEEILRAEDESFVYGMYGCGSRTMGRTAFGDFLVHAAL